MKLLPAVICSLLLTTHAQQQERVSCLDGRRDSCSVCPIDFSENGYFHNFNLCAGDCQVEGEGDRRVCVPKESATDNASIDETQLSTTAYVETPNSYRANQTNEDCVIQNLQYWGGEKSMTNYITEEISLEECQEKCKTTFGCTWFNYNHPSCSTCEHTNACFLFASKGTIEMPASGRFSGGAHSINCHSSSDMTSRTDPTTSSLHTNQVLADEATSVLTAVIMKIRNPTNNYDTPKILFNAKVCVDIRCCETEMIRKRNGVFIFSDDFQNLGNCHQMRRSQHQTVTVTPKKIEQTDLQIMTIKVEFENDIMVAKNSFLGLIPLQWGESIDMTQTNERPGNSDALPDIKCPEHESPSTNTCPRINVRVHTRLPDAPKFCYYQKCSTFSSDLSRVVTGEQGLGTGGYCVAKEEMKPQYEYCCDLEQYFTDIEGNMRQEIRFPRCESMNVTRNDI